MVCLRHFSLALQTALRFDDMLGRRVVDLESICGLFNGLLLEIDHPDELIPLVGINSLVASLCLLGTRH